MGSGSSKVGGGGGGGRGAARMQKIKQLQKDLSAAKRQETRAENDYRKKRLSADLYGGNSISELNKRLDSKINAEKKYNQATKKRKALQARYDKLTKGNKRRDTDGPLF